MCINGQMADANNDGNLDESEFHKLIEKLFKRREMISLFSL